MKQHALSRSTSVLWLLAVALGPLGCASQTAGPADAQEVAAEFQSIIETLAADEMEGRDAGTAGIDLARDYLIDRFEDAGLEPGFVIDGEPGFGQPFVITTGVGADGEPVRATVSNVGGILPGQGELADQVLVVGGHYDHLGYGHFGSRSPDRKGEIHPGADDNASGTAGVVLLAQRLAAYAKANPDAPRRTVLFTCFAGEERGLLGSRYMVNHPGQWPFEPEQLAGMINLDMIGRLTDGDLYVFSDATGTQWRGWINELNQDIGLDLKFDVRPPGGSDHTLFVSIGCPAVFFNTWLNDDYHTANDTPDKINAAGGAQIIDLVGQLLERAATTQERITFVAPPPPRPRPVLGVRLAEAEDGVLAQGVLDRGPAARGGLLVGDVITAFDGKPVHSPGEVRAAINRADAGDEVVLTVKRGEEMLELTVTLGMR